MMIIIKFYILIALNLFGVALLAVNLIYNGKTYPEALNACWNRIVLNHRTASGEWNNLMNCYSMILNKMWWFMLFSVCVLWIVDESLDTIIMLGVLLIIHLYWYFGGGFRKENSYNRVIHLNSSWGIVFQEIDESSFLKNRSLAELDLRKKNLLVLAIERGQQTISFPKGVEILTAGDRLVIFGDLNYYRGMGDEAI